MRSLIIIEVEHGETTDPLVALVDLITDGIKQTSYGYTVNDYTVKVDLPSCFVLKQ